MKFWLFYALLHLPLVLLACPTTQTPIVPPIEIGDGAALDVDTPWTPKSDANDLGFVIAPVCDQAAHVLHALGCAEGADERRFGITCTMSRTNAFDFREDCVAHSKTVDDVRRCCGTGEVCSHIRCRPASPP